MDISFERSIQLLGDEAFSRLHSVRVILFGVGGVGGWCAEALVRTGLVHLTIVDFDEVAPSNINRQVVATSLNIGKPKVLEMRERLLSINPSADIVAVCQRYSADTADGFDFSGYDYVIDAIDSVADKALLIQQASASSAVLFSSMGAARKIDASAVRVAQFRNVEGCPLARALRHYIKKNRLSVDGRFLCVYSPELSAESGTIAPVVGVFGFTLADLVVRHVLGA